MNAGQVKPENRQRTIGASALRDPIVRCPACSAEGGAPASPRSAGCKGIFLKRGQQAIEYALYISAVSLSLIFMFTYAKRGVQAAIKGSADQMSKQYESEQVVDPTETQSGGSTMVTEASDSSQTTQIGNQYTYATDLFSNSYGTASSTSTTY